VGKGKFPVVHAKLFEGGGGVTCNVWREKAGCGKRMKARGGAWAPEKTSTEGMLRNFRGSVGSQKRAWADIKPEDPMHIVQGNRRREKVIGRIKHSGHQKQV